MGHHADGDYSDVARTLRMSLRERPKKTHTERKLRGKTDELKFLEDFDPETSNREKRKLRRKGPSVKVVNAYDEYGRIRWNGLDICDCLDEQCPGCWYECEHCNSCRCGEQCRRNRKFFYESITFDGKDAQIKNKYCQGK